MSRRRGSRKNRKAKVLIEEYCVVSSWNSGGENEGKAQEPSVALHHFETNEEPHGIPYWSAWRDCWKQLGWSPSLFQLHVWSSWKESAIQIVAPTGSGKTVAYGLPLLQTKLSVVLVPTRELCRQVQQECQRMARSHHSIMAWYGGTVDKKSQFTAFKQRRGSSTIIVATPGRMWDMLQSFPDSEFDLSVLVLDEADRLALNAELSEQVHNIAKALKPTKVILCSATQSSNSREVWTQWMEPAFGVVPNVTAVQVVSNRKAPTSESQHLEDETDQPNKRRLEGTEIWSQIPTRVTQIVHVCAQHKKPPKLIKTLSKVSGPGLVFFAKISTLQYISQLLNKSTELKVMEYHSRLTQREREKPLQGIVLTTDLCARGIHWEEAKFVVNYDFPGNLETYIHRCGRVGRKSDGTVYSFFTRNFQKLAPDLVRLLESTNQWIDPNLQQLSDESQEGVHEPMKKKQKTKQQDKPKGKDLDQLLDDEEKAFAALAGDRIVLKRASHVSDASSSSDESSDDEN